MAKTSRSDTAYSVTVSSEPPHGGSMTVWALRDFLQAVEEAGIPDNAEIIDQHSQTGHLTGLRVRHTFVVEQAKEPRDA